MKVRLDIVIEYAHERFLDAEQTLCDAAEHLYDNGLLSGEWDNEDAVVECTHKVTLLEEDTK